MRDLPAFGYALSSLIALGSLIWGIGSMGMNGTADSTLGTNLAITAICGLIALACWSLAGIG